MKLNKKEDLFKPIREIWENIEYKNMVSYNEQNALLQENKIITRFNSHIDSGLFHSITNYDNMNLSLCIGLNKNESYEYYTNNLKQDYLLYGIKSLEYDLDLLVKIIYQLYYFRTSFQSKQDVVDYISNNLKNILINSDLSLPLSSHSKMNVNVLILVSRRANLKIMNESNKNHTIYMPNDINEKYIISSLFFCKTSIDFLQKQDFDKYFSIEFNNSKLNFEKYESFLRNNIDVKNRSKFMLYSSVVLYLLGSRKANDIDLYIHNIPDEIKEKTNIFQTEEYNFIDYSIKGTDNWPTHWNQWLDEWAKLSNAKYFEEILGNDQFHFYFLGVKIISLECDIARRIKRLRPAAMADLIILKERFHCPITIPSIPDNIVKYKKMNELSDKENQKCLEKNTEYNSDTREYIFEVKNDKNRFTNTMNNYLKERYNYTTSPKKMIKIKIRK